MPIPGGFEFHVAASPQERLRSERTPFRILVFGDFSGRTSPDSSLPLIPPLHRSVLHVDVDNFEARMSQLSPLLPLPAGEGTEVPELLTIRSLEDFHPDRLWSSLRSFQDLRGIRNRLLDPATFADAARELAAMVGPDLVAPPGRVLTPVDQPSPPGAREEDAATLERLLGGRRHADPQAERRKAEVAAGLEEFLAKIIRDDIVAPEDPRREEVSHLLDEVATVRMRRLLHDTRFQTLESTWRSLYGLVSAVTDDVQIGMLDVTKEEMTADIPRDSAPAVLSSYKRVVEPGARGSGEEPWHLIVAGFTFGPDPDDLRLLGALAMMASTAGTPLLGGAGLDLIGAATVQDLPDPGRWLVERNREEGWRAFRRTPEARWVGLACPRVILRLPYGRGRDPIESFEFEEIEEGRPEHGAFLWGNPAFSCTLLLAADFMSSGGSSSGPGPSGTARLLEDLPSHSYRNEHGEVCLTPCAEVLLGNAAAEAIQQRGIMPMLSHAHRNIVQVPTFQSVADPPGPLEGLRGF